jgi:hypothetical protein
MRAINVILTEVFEVILVGPASLFREAGLWIVSVILGVLMVMIFGRLSNQAAIARRKEIIKGHLLSLSLYPHELRVALGTYGRIFISLGAYMGLLLAPTLVLIVPFVIVAIQLEARFGRLPLRPGQTAVVTAEFPGAIPPDVVLVGPEGGEVTVETPAVRIPSRKEVSWRVKAHREGEFSLTLRDGEKEYPKRVVVGEGVQTVSAQRPGRIPDQILFPVEGPLDGIEGIRLEYPRAQVRLLTWETHWMVFFVLVSIAVALVARYPLGVEF